MQTGINDMGKDSKDDNLRGGLIPAIIQDYRTGKVLMLAYMNKESLIKSIETGTTWFWSRSRGKLWNKGETSGNFQNIKEIKYDCDQDALLIIVNQVGNVCHTGEHSCFYRELKDDTDILNFIKTGICSGNADILAELYDVIKERIKEENPASYTHALHKKGLDEMLKKLGEESIEVILAAKHQEKENIIYEIADLVYHMLVLMVNKKITLDEIFKELGSRRK